MEYLFIGGVSDGKRIRTDGSRVVTIPILQEAPAWNASGFEMRSSFATETYHACPLVENGNEYLVYAIKGVSVLRSLISGYEGAKQKA